MNIVAITDLHDCADILDAFAGVLDDANIVLLAGDLTNFGDRAGVAHIIETVRAHCPVVLAVPGNCDPPVVGAYLDDEGISLDGRHKIVDGIAFAGLGGSLPCPSTTPHERPESELAAVLDRAVAGLDPSLPLVLVSHQPPRDTALDVVSSGQHVGSVSVRNFIAQHRPAICFTGHIHESAGLDKLGPTHLVNPGPFNAARYATARIDAGHVQVQNHSLPR